MHFKKRVSFLISLFLVIALAWFNDLGVLSRNLLTLPLQTAMLCFIAVFGYTFFTSFKFQQGAQLNGSSFEPNLAFKDHASNTIASLTSGGAHVTFFVVPVTLALLGILYLSTSIEFSYIEAGGQSIELKIFSKNILNFGILVQTIELMVVSLLVSLLLAIFSGRNAFERRLKDKIFQRQRIAEIFKATGTASVSQGLHLTIYVIIGLSFFDQLPVLSLIAVAAIVSFCANLPLSIHGWGVRELASVAVFNTLGIPATESLAYSIAVGLIYTSSIFLTDKIVALYGKNRAEKPGENGEKIRGKTQDNNLQTTRSRPLIEGASFNRSIALFCGLLCAIFVFFQFYTNISGGWITINLADSIALLGLTVVSIQFLFFKQLPFYLTGKVWIWLGLCIFALLIGIIVGITEFGITQWAMVNRGFGFFIILGYFACGAMMSGQFGQHGIRRLVEVFVITLFVVFTATVFYKWAYDPPSRHWTFSAFSANRNIFAFQVLTVFTLFIVFLLPPLCKNKGISRNKIFSIIVGIFIIYMTYNINSRTMYFCVISIFIICFLFKNKYRNILFLIFLISFSLFDPRVKYYLNTIPNAEAAHVDDSDENLNSLFSKIDNIYRLNAGKDILRLQIITDGLNAWSENPILGAGIGYAVQEKKPVIHSTWLWILAEMGLVGIFLIGVIPLHALGALWYAFRSKAKHGIGGLSARQSGLVLILFVFILFGMMHDLAYQRIFWLILGALLAQPPKKCRIQRSF